MYSGSGGASGNSGNSSSGGSYGSGLFNTFKISNRVIRNIVT